MPGVQPTWHAMNILLVTDAWHPQVSGVVRTWTVMCAILASWGHQVRVIEPGGARSFGAPSEPTLRLCLRPGQHFRQRLGDFRPDVVHISTEGPLGLAARRYALKHGWRFTTSFHTMFPDYLKVRMGVPSRLSWAYMRWFHKPSQRVLVPTRNIAEVLTRHGMARLEVWARGVDLAAFSPDLPEPLELAHLPRPVWLNVGRVAREKNLDAFLSLNLPGTKVVVGSGPEDERLRRQYPDVIFTGPRRHADLPPYYAAADVFVFPSMTDTFGLVMLEAMACGTPVAALPADAPREVVQEGVTGCLDADLRAACLRAAQLPRGAVREGVRAFTWEAIAQQFLDALFSVSTVQSRPS